MTGERKQSLTSPTLPTVPEIDSCIIWPGLVPRVVPGAARPPFSVHDFGWSVTGCLLERIVVMDKIVGFPTIKDKSHIIKKKDMGEPCQALS